jgi:hypothetical protein
MHYPEVKEHFKRLGITDVITQAYYCEVFLEMVVCKSFAGVLKKAGIDVSQKAHLKKLEQRRQKDGEESKDAMEKKFIYDGKFSNALNQLTLRIRRLNPYNKKHRQGIPVETIRLAKEIWLMLEGERKQSEDGRVGEALGWMSRALSKREGAEKVIPPLRGSCESRSLSSSSGPSPGSQTPGRQIPSATTS